MPLIDWDQSRQQFIAGKIGIFFDTPARMRQVTDLIGDKFTLGTAHLPDRRQGQRQAADRRQRRRSSPRATRRSRRPPGSSSNSSPAPRRRRSSSRRPAICRRTCARRAGIRRSLLRSQPELPDRDPAGRALGALAGLSGRQLGPHLAHAARDHQRGDARHDEPAGRPRQARHRDQRADEVAAMRGARATALRSPP